MGNSQELEREEIKQDGIILYVKNHKECIKILLDLKYKLTR
jgi:hypothetical protein